MRTLFEYTSLEYHRINVYHNLRCKCKTSPVQPQGEVHYTHADLQYNRGMSTQPGFKLGASGFVVINF